MSTSDSQDNTSNPGQKPSAAPTDPDPFSPLASIAPEETEHVRWARRNVPGADRPGISASELANLCIRYLRQLLDKEEP